MSRINLTGWSGAQILGRIILVCLRACSCGRGGWSVLTARVGAEGNRRHYLLLAALAPRSSGIPRPENHREDVNLFCVQSRTSLGMVEVWEAEPSGLALFRTQLRDAARTKQDSMRAAEESLHHGPFSYCSLFTPLCSGLRR